MLSWISWPLKTILGYRDLLENSLVSLFYLWIRITFTYYYSDGQFGACKWISDNPVLGYWATALSYDTRAHQFHPPPFDHLLPHTYLLSWLISSHFRQAIVFTYSLSKSHRLTPSTTYRKQQGKVFCASPTCGLDLSWLHVDDHQEPPDQATIDSATSQPSGEYLHLKIDRQRT